MIEQLLIHEYPVILECLLLAWVALVYFAFPEITKALKVLVTRRGLATAAALVVAGAAIRIVWFPPRHQVYFDEYVHEDLAHNIATSNSFGESLAGGDGTIPIIHPASWPAGFHVLLGSVIKIGGFSENSAFRFNAALASISIFLIYLLGTSLFDEEYAGLAAAALFTIMPLHIRFSGTTELTICSTLWIILTLILLSVFLRSKSYPVLMLLILTILFTVNVRFENLVLAAACLCIYAFNRRGFQKLTGRQALLLLTASVLVTIPTIAILILNRREGLLGFDTAPLDAPVILLNNLSANLRYLGGAASLILILLTILGLTLARKDDRFWMIRLLGIGTAYLLICSLHPRGDFSLGTSERLAMPTILMMILSASCGVKAAHARIGGKWPLLAVLIAAFAFINRDDYGQGPLGRYEAESRLVSKTADLLPPHAYVIAYCVPMLLSLTHNPAISPKLLLAENDDMLSDLDYNGTRPLILFRDVWWYKFAGDSQRAEELIARRYDMKPLALETIDSKEYGFFILTRKNAAIKKPHT